MVLIVLYHVLNFGWLVAIGYYVFGALLCLTIVFFPLGLSMFTIGKWHFSPFKNRLIGRKKLKELTKAETEEKEKKWWDALVPIANVLWAILFGWWLVAVQAIAAVGSCVGIVTIPMGIAQFRTIGTLFAPFGVTIITEDEYKELKLQSSKIVSEARQNT